MDYMMDSPSRDIYGLIRQSKNWKDPFKLNSKGVQASFFTFPFYFLISKFIWVFYCIFFFRFSSLFGSLFIYLFKELLTFHKVNYLKKTFNNKILN
jgi:hypothetical protein